MAGYKRKFLSRQIAILKSIILGMGILALLPILLVCCSKSNINNSINSDGLKVSFIDVEHGDSILVRQGRYFMLIDSGLPDQGTKVADYIKQQGANKLDYLVLTHPHEDHIGGAETVVKSFNIGEVYMTNVTAPTKLYKDVITSLKDKNLKVTTPKPGDSFKLGDAACTVLAPNSDQYVDMNDFSIVIKLVYGSISFLFTGDALTLSEKDILNKGFNVKADVLKIGHHGSYNATSNEFLKAVIPKYAVISCGKNDGRHEPSKIVMDRLKRDNIIVYRTDEAGTIICTSDGQRILFNTSPGDYIPGK